MHLLCVCVCARARASHRACEIMYSCWDLLIYSSIDVLKCRCSHTAAHMGNILLEHFYNTGNMWPCLLRSLSSPSFSTLQQSQEWLSRPCKDACERERERWSKHTGTNPRRRIPVRVGDSGQGREPSLSEGTNLTQALFNTKASNSRLFLWGTRLLKLCTPWCFYRRTVTPPLTTLLGHRKCIYFGELLFHFFWAIVALFLVFVCV